MPDVKLAPNNVGALAGLYERLRAERGVARQSEVSARGAVLFAREGMAAWTAAVVASTDRFPDGGPSRSPPLSTLPAPVRRELVLALTSLVHCGAQRQEHM